MPPSSSPDATLTDGEDPVRRRVIVHLILAFAAEPATTPTVRLQEIRDIRRGTSPRVARLVALLSTLAARSGGRSDARADGPNPPSDVDRSTGFDEAACEVARRGDASPDPDADRRGSEALIELAS